MLFSAPAIWHCVRCVVVRGQGWEVMPQSSSSGSSQGCSEDLILRKKAIAESVYQQEVARWEKDKSSNKTGQWVNTVVEAGTIRDKVNGLVLLIQQSPFHRIATLDQLLTLTLSSTTRVAILAIESVKALFFASYIPDTKLSFFSKHFESISEEEAEGVSIQDLVRWFYEDAVKARYSTFIQALEKAAHSSLIESKNVAIGTLQKMLVEKPEQEQAILSVLIDKMGDPNTKTANWAVNLLLGVLEKHPSMKEVVVKEVQLFINKHSPLRTTVPLMLLSHIVLIEGEEELANRLVATYFLQLKLISERKLIKIHKNKNKKTKSKSKSKNKNKNKKDGNEENSVDSKMVSVLLTGVNRAHPYAKLPQDVYESHLQILFFFTEHGGFNRKVLALAVILKVIHMQREVSDSLDAPSITRFYHLLYDILLSAELGSGFGQPNYKQAFFTLVQSAVLADKDPYRARAFLKRILVMAANARPGFACNALLLASYVFQKTSSLSSMTTSTAAPTIPKNLKVDSLFQQEENQSCLWEVVALRSHYHPLVARWAQWLSANRPVVYHGNPIDDLSLGSFLSHFQNKQAPSKEREKGKVKEMQPKKHQAPSYSVTVKNFQNKQESEIRPDELYFFKYLQLKISILEREDQGTTGHKHKQREGKGLQVSAEALEGLLEDEDDDGNFALEGVELNDLGEESDDEIAEGNPSRDKRGEKRKEPPTTNGKQPNKKQNVVKSKSKGKAGNKSKPNKKGPQKKKNFKKQKRK